MSGHHTRERSPNHQTRRLHHIFRIVDVLVRQADDLLGAALQHVRQGLGLILVRRQLLEQLLDDRLALQDVLRADLLGVVVDDVHGLGDVAPEQPRRLQDLQLASLQLALGLEEVVELDEDGHRLEPIRIERMLVHVLERADTLRDRLLQHPALEVVLRRRLRHDRIQRHQFLACQLALLLFEMLRDP